jgi:hypothetical protein
MLCEYDFELLDEGALVEGLLHCEVDKSTESILLCMFDADDIIAAQKDTSKARNRRSAQQARDADKLFMQLLQAELQQIIGTFELYATYTRTLTMHVAFDKEGMHLFAKRHATHKQNVALLEASSDVSPTDVKVEPPAESRQARNRQTAQKSRQKRARYIRDLTKERDEIFVTLEEIVKYTTALESSCSFLDVLNEYVSAPLMEIRQKLFDRTCAHQDKYRELKSHLTYRGTFRANFK